MDELTQLADRYGSDKGSTAYGQHHYTKIYHDLFLPFRNRPISFLEIGLLHPVDGSRGSDAPSLRMWKEYFADATLTGFDIDDYSCCKIDNVTIIQGDMENLADLQRLCSRGPFDVILEDASHASHHQQIALGFLFPHLKQDGLYIIEDLNWQPSHLEKQGVKQTRHLLREFQKTGELESVYMSSDQQNYIKKNIGSMEFYDTQDIYNDDKIDAVAIIRKL